MLKAVKSIMNIVFYYLIDMLYYIRYSTELFSSKREHLERDILIMTHVIEKGLSYSRPRLGYGKIKIKELVNKLMKYMNMGYDTNAFAFKNAISVLQQYIVFHQENGLSNNEIITFINEKLELFISSPNIGSAGIITKYKEEINTKNTFEDIFLGRSSVREFDETDINDDDIHNAIRLALNAPSACNRQPCKVYIVKSKNTLKSIQNYHKGMKGFNNIKRIFVITVDSTKYKYAGDRNLMYVDGALFAMSLVLSLQSKNIATCIIQWQSLLSNDRFIRKLLNIPNKERIILLVAGGNYQDTFKICKSAKMEIDDFFQVV